MKNQIIGPILSDYLAQEALRQYSKKKLLGGYYIPGLAIIPFSQRSFEKGCIVGCAKSNQIDILSLLVFQPGSESQQNVRTIWREEAHKRLCDYGNDPESFYDFWSCTQYPNMDLSRDAKVLSKKKMPLHEVLHLNQFWVSSGIAFGTTYPEIVRKMWTVSYDTPPDPALVDLAQQTGWVQNFGCDPADLKLISFEEATQQALIELATYVHKYRPELSDPFGLNIT
jgi:hypothetical protein